MMTFQDVGIQGTRVRRGPLSLGDIEQRWQSRDVDCHESCKKDQVGATPLWL